MHFAHNTHVLTHTIVLFFKDAILLLQMNVSIEETFGLLLVSSLTETGLPFGYDAFGNTGFFCKSESICPDDFCRPLGRSLARIPAQIGVPTSVVDPFSPLIKWVIIQKIRIGVIVEIPSLFLVIIQEEDRFHITNVVEDKIFFRVTIARSQGPTIHYMLIKTFECLNVKTNSNQLLTKSL